ncbi:uncharacterized protein PRCAT00001220001 [Priceomyces carsonii]|uniref:uncharacterized protein n=1 Tax=Priceomyces carsonii TaxID=28549 RepID=UPI002ED95E47|nr:unnamed protein product [Priceomyces carsonii]
MDRDRDRARRRSQNSSRSRGSTSLDRRRVRHGSVTSFDSSTNYLLDDNNHEMYSGAASEIMPSSITSLHYPHKFGNLKSRQGSGVSYEVSLLLENDNQVELGSVGSNATSSSFETQAKFKFFSPHEIEQAPGGSTLENPQDPVDYNTEWEYSVGKYNNDDILEQDISKSVSSLHSTQSPDDGDYGSMSSRFDRHRRRDSDSDKSNLSVSESLISHNNVDDSQNIFLSTAEYQRFYLAEEDLVIGIAGYSNSLLKKFLYYLICFFTLGIGYLILRWLPKYRINLTGNRCPLGKAEWCVVENEFGELSVINVERRKYNERLSNFLTVVEDLLGNGIKENDPIVHYIHSFTYRYIKFFYNPVEGIFKSNSRWYDLHWLNMKNIKDGVSQSKFEQRLEIFGENNTEIEEKPISQLLSEEILHPFYIFQIFSIFLWLADDYYYYASCIFLISVASIVDTLIETKSTMRRLQNISRFTCEVRVWRNEFWKQIESTELVPGDVFEVDPSLNVLPCDSLLLNGECIVNESMLTGESVPVAKVSANHDTLQSLTDDFTSPLLAKSFLYSGTKLLKTRSTNDEPAIGMALKTGFNTTKGSLIRSMLFPKPTGFKFYRDSFKYIGFMTLIAAMGFIYSTYNFIQLGISKKVMTLRALDIITIVVPPALPATLTIGTTFAINRLKRLQIYCIAPTKINIGGKLDVLCFDKTGTLTEDGLDVLGAHLTKSASGRKEIIFEDIKSSPKDLSKIHSLKDHELNNGLYLLGCMATCHSLKLLEGELLGDPLDYKMFSFSGWKFEETGTGFQVYPDYNRSEGYCVIKEFEFISSLRRMSVIAMQGDNKMVFTKGAPEVICDICDPDTLPSNYSELLHQYTHGGYRVIACAYKRIAEDLSREASESGLNFAGFIIFENKLKSSTTSTIMELKNANIRTVMCTGDNVLTAISVGTECKLIDASCKDIYIPSLEETTIGYRITWSHFLDSEKKLDPESFQPLDLSESLDYKLAITGDIFRYLLTEVKDSYIIHHVLMKCDIFARMSPDEKHELVEQLQKIDYTVGFCGDGANDCGALKAADVGVSLSEAEASVAAPITSRVFEISCVLDVIKEGRSSLVTSFACFKYMSLYSAIQFVSVTILYQRGTNLGDFQFLYIDLFLILPLAIFMSWSKPYFKIIPKRPTANLVSPKVLIPMIGHILIILLFQTSIWLKVQKEPWYIKPVPGGDDEVQSSDNTVLFLFTTFQYILIAIVLSRGPPYREPVHKNRPFTVNVVLAIVISICLFTIDSDSWWGQVFQLTNLSRGFYWLILICALLNLVIMVSCEHLVFDKVVLLYKKIFLKHTGISKKTFKNLLREFSKRETV